ncbi:MAG: GlsB/YeaQ/YmgE family stress response membrane protein [Desulfurivibrionaceae bacterium]
MEIENLLIFLAIGAVAGWLAGLITKGQGFGIIGNMVVGIIGALLGGFLFSWLGITAGGLIGSLVMATVGAVVLLFAIRIVKKA